MIAVNRCHTLDCMVVGVGGEPSLLDMSSFLRHREDK